LFVRVAATIERHRMFAPGQRVAVAVSGGADSVCLLHVLLHLAPRWNLSLSVLHLNHGLRGEESREDAEFVRCLSSTLGLPCTVREADVAASPDNLEQAARAARLAFFREQIAAGAADRVAVGHTRSDQAETVLFRFLRGSGTAGLAGIRPVTSGGIVRPLLEVDRAEVEQFLLRRGIPWRQDSSNRSLEFARNRIRHELLPQLAGQWNPAIAETLAHMADWALAEESWWETEMDRLAPSCLSEIHGCVLLNVASLRALPLAAARRLIRRAMDRAKGNLRGIGFEHIAAVLKTAASTKGAGCCQVPGLEILRSFNWLRFAKPDAGARPNSGFRFPVSVPGTVLLPAPDPAISLELIERQETSEVSDSVYNGDMGDLDWQRLSGSLEIRSWKPGDQYHPHGCTGEEKIKTLFQHSRIPLWERRNWPILTDGPAIVWARRFGPAASFAAGPASRVILRIRETETQ
jgi:tRNA(Ile)-lysidine synthase